MCIIYNTIYTIYNTIFYQRYSADQRTSDGQLVIQHQAFLLRELWEGLRRNADLSFSQTRPAPLDIWRPRVPPPNNFFRISRQRGSRSQEIQYFLRLQVDQTRFSAILHLTNIYVYIITSYYINAKIVKLNYCWCPKRGFQNSLTSLYFSFILRV